MIAQSQPEDSVPITRRAVEAASVALAIKLNEENTLHRTSYQERHDRWLKRQQGEKPKSFRVEFVDVRGDALVEGSRKFGRQPLGHAGHRALQAHREGPPVGCIRSS